ncbi:MAG: choloylglycine hydrolase [Sarcina sp.]
MCTALLLKTKDNEHLFGRNMDIEYTFNQSVGIIPRNYEYKNMSTGSMENTKNAIIGMMTIIENHPMLADGMNEKGLAIAGLNFPGYSYLEEECILGKFNIPGYDFMLWILSNFDTLEEVKKDIENVNLMNTQINKQYPAPTLHWIITDKTGESIVIEKTKFGMKIFENYVGVLTNSPTFDWHITNLRQYISLSEEQVLGLSWSEQLLEPLGQGTGLVGIPGDFTPASRFVRIAYLRHAALMNEKNILDVKEFYHLLGNVAMVKGSVRTPENLSDITQYTACMNLEKNIYYYNTYNNNQLNAIQLEKEDLDCAEIKLFDYKDTLNVNYQN